MYVVYILYIILSVYINVAVGFDDFSNKIFLVKKTMYRTYYYLCKLEIMILCLRIDVIIF